jgi:hypothetical protein
LEDSEVEEEEEEEKKRVINITFKKYDCLTQL